MAVVRGPLPTDNFTMVSNDWARDADLSYKAKGLLLAICSHREGYRLTVQQLVAQGKDGRDAVKAGLRELVDAGYMRVIQNRGGNGQMSEVDYVLTGKLSADDAGSIPEGEESARSRQRRTRSAPVTDFPSPGAAGHNRRSEPVTDFPSPGDTEADQEISRSEPVAGSPSPENPSTENPPLRRPLSKKTNSYVTSTSRGSAVDNSVIAVPPVAKSTGGAKPFGIAGDGDLPVDHDEVERILAHLPDRLRPTTAEAMRLRPLIAQRMQRGWTRETVLAAVERRLRPGGTLDNPCGLFAKILVPLEEPPGTSEPEPGRQHPLSVAKPWCGNCDEKTRFLLDDCGFPDNAGPKCQECEQLLFAEYTARGAS